ncbi:threonine synthase [Melioribacter roseus P3M-2]|uniref:Threonine synthase n=1 Tax=Melioribacter roseus (strain DSM 23840 / JCM 17771 / VKM B-2668 / P3M-2) TaxID=1191523 RepID=I6ZQM4_MELRP|nr:threonine synthase [Melioribacter roseus]AFN74374.1 threonine synthase [Melioribacter roseus P3M-2]
MKFYSTNDKKNIVDFETAVMEGLAKDGGLFMPVEIPSLQKEIIDSIENFDFGEIAFRITKNFAGEEIGESDLSDIIREAINFPAPLVNLKDDLMILELFHGPTLAFKDFGARFMAKTMGYFVKKKESTLNILVATSGDTGSAVAYGFYETPGINVYILYPKGKVSLIQEKQLTTLDKNITALEIDGTFDDCQRLVKNAFVDEELNSKLNLTSANSINIARLLPQSFYYFEAYKQIREKSIHSVFSVPSGNLGNLTAGLIAKKMGLPITKFIGAVNSNHVFADFVNSGIFKPHPSVQTLSNAMDVGNPSNLARIRELYGDSLSDIQRDIHSKSYDDAQTRRGIREVYEKYGYIIDPHGAVGYMAVRDYETVSAAAKFNKVILETAHPAKFKDVIEDELGIEVEVPERLAACLNKQKKSVRLSSDYEELKEFLLGAV